MELTFDELLKYAKRTIKDMHDENGNIKMEYQNIIDKINRHPEYLEIVNRLQNADTMEKIEILREGFNAIATMNEEQSNMDVSHSNEQVKIDTSKLNILKQYPELLQRDDVVTSEERDMYSEALENQGQEFTGNQNGNQMSMPKVLTLSNGHSIYSDERKAGFINLFLLSLTTGFAGGIITAIMIGIIK